MLTCDSTVALHSHETWRCRRTHEPCNLALHLVPPRMSVPDCAGVQVYMHPNQLADCLRDPEILEMVQNAQLKLVLNDSFPELFTFCLRLNGSVTASEKVAHAGGVNSSISAGEKVSCCKADSGNWHGMPRCYRVL